MTTVTLSPFSLRILHGMQHAGLSGNALKIEQSAPFKLAFMKTITRDIGFSDQQFSMKTALPTDGSELSSHHTAFLSSFGPAGHPPHDEMRRFIDAEIARHSPVVLEGLGTIKTGDAVSDCCYWVKGVWYTCGAFAMLRDGAAWTSQAVVEQYEQDQGPIESRVDRHSVATISLIAQVEWGIEYS